MSNDRFHLIIPSSNIKKEVITKGSGGKSYDRDDLVTHSRALKQNFKDINNELAKHKESSLSESVIIAIKTPDGWAASNEKFHLESLGLKLINYNKNDPTIATVYTTKKKWLEIGNRIDKYAETKGIGKTYFQGIDNFLQRPITDKILFSIDNDDNFNSTINLFSIISLDDRKRISEEIVKDCDINGYTAKLVILSDDVLVTISAPIKYIRSIAEEYTTIKTITKNEVINIEKSTATFPVPSLQVLSNPTTTQIIGVVDDGISIRSDLNHLVVDRIPPKLINAVAPITHHGTYVSSRCLFGDINEDMLGKPLQPACYIADIPVFGIDKFGTEVSPSESDLIEAIDSYVNKNYTKVRIYNLSLGFGDPINANQFSLAAKLLDKLSKKFDVLFIVSSGNINFASIDFPDGHFQNPLSKITSPSESLLCLCVGSIAKKDSPMSHFNEISPFSRVGPGLNGSIKPDLVCHGGNFGDSFKTDVNVCTVGLSHLSGQCDKLSGTSFSAPVISYYASQILDYYPSFSMNMVKALLIHFADKRPFPLQSSIDPILGCGYGEPNLEYAFTTNSNACVYLYEGSLDDDNYEYVYFDIPKMDSDENYDLSVRVTIVYDPEVNEDNDTEYCSVRISSNILKLNDERYVKQTPDEKNLSETYNPIIRYEKHFKRSITPGEWAVKLRMFTRNIVEDKYQQKYAIIIEITDETYNRDLRKYVLEENEGKYTLSRMDEKTA